MSMDISIWSRSPPNLPLDLPRHETWERDEYQGNAYFVYEHEEWLINVGTGDASRSANLPDASARCETYVSLEPIGASAEGYAFLESVVRTLTKSCDGYWEHPGNGHFYRHNEGPF